MATGWPEAIDEAGVTTTEGEYIKVDSIIVSSGYKYDFNFLNGKIVELEKCEKKIKNLYRQIIPAQFPTLGL